MHPFSRLTPSPALRAFAQRLAFELLVVFVGVWAALLLQSAREAHAARNRADRILMAIKAEIDNNLAWNTAFRDSVANELGRWKAAYAAHDLQPPAFFRIPGAERGPTVAWQAALASSALEVLDPELVFAIGNYYHEWAGIGDRVTRYMAVTDELMLPYDGLDLDVYFANGRLRPTYAGMIRIEEDILFQWQVLDIWGRDLRAKIAAQLGTADSS